MPTDLCAMNHLKVFVLFIVIHLCLVNCDEHTHVVRKKKLNIMILLIKHCIEVLAVGSIKYSDDVAKYYLQ